LSPGGPLSASGGSWQPMGLDQIAMQLLGIGLLALWAAGSTLLVFKTVESVMSLRVSAEAEEAGLDDSEHNTSSYPEFWQSR